MFCHQCGKPNRDGARYCADCGAAFQAACASCRRILPAGARFCPSCGHRVPRGLTLPRNASGAIQPGTLLRGRYQIETLLGLGGFGAVYLARDSQRLGARCAVKESFETSQESQRQFEREAALLLRLDHPGLVRVTDHFRTAAGEGFLVMDYVEGPDLDQLLEAATADLAEARLLDWAIRVCDVLAYMHNWTDPATGRRSPIIHRDVKPSNLKLRPDDSIVLIDLGIAKVKEPGRKTTRAAQAVSPPYSPLEQYGQGTDERSDIYALGASLYHLATRTEPPAAPDLAGRPLLPPRHHRPGLSTGLEEVILRAMQPRPAGRFQTIGDLRAALLACGSIPDQPPAAVRQTLASALERRKWVYLSYVDGNGRATRRSVLPTAVSPSYLLGYCDLRQDTRRFLIRRISYASVEESRPAPPLAVQAGVYIRPISDRAASHHEPQWVADPAPYVASGDWEIVPLQTSTGPAPLTPPPELDGEQAPAGWLPDPRSATPPPYDPAPLYQRALAAFDQGDHRRAVDLFAEVLRWQPGNREALRLLRAAQRHVAGTQPLEELYDKAMRNLQRKQWNAAVQKLDQIHQARPGFRDVDDRLPEARRRLAEHKRQLDLARRYRRALAFYDGGDWQKAVAHFTRLARRQPRYKDTERRILEASRNLRPAD